MNEETIQRLLYYKGQLLTAQDFEDQQNYHLQKLGQLTQRFPPGIVRGLSVIISSQGANNTNDPEAFLITGGLAIDAGGNTIVVPEKGLRVPVDEANGKDKTPYLSLKYTENKTRRSQSPLDDSKFNRVNEIVEVTWEKAPNISVKAGSRITVAKIRLKTNADRLSEKVGATYVIEDEAQPGEPTIRQDAGLITEKQIAKNAISTEKIIDKAVSQEKLADNVTAIPKGPAGGDLNGEYPDPTIADDAVKSAKIANWVAGSNPETGIKEAHIQNGAVTTAKLAPNIEATPKDDSVKSAKIANWVAGSNPETGIKEAHIQNGAVTTAKLAPNVEATPKDDSVKSAKIANWVAGSNPETGIKEAHIQNGAITSGKLKLVSLATTTPGIVPINPATSSPYTVEVSPSEIIQVIPTSGGGPLTWSSDVEYASTNTLKYRITVTNINTIATSPAVNFKIVKINFGT